MCMDTGKKWQHCDMESLCSKLPVGVRPAGRNRNIEEKQYEAQLLQKGIPA